MKRFPVILIIALLIGTLNSAWALPWHGTGSQTKTAAFHAAPAGQSQSLQDSPQGLIQNALDLIGAGTNSQTPPTQPSQSPAVNGSQSSPIVAPLLVGPFQVVGNKIIDGTGKQMVFRGIVRDGTERPKEWGRIWPTDAEIGHIKDWGANLVRVPLDEAQWVNTCSFRQTDDPNYPGLVDAEVNSITSRGMFALLELNFNPISNCGKTGAQEMADAAHAVTFWQAVAARYKGNPLVGFDLYNEPGNLNDAQWLNGGVVVSRRVGVFNAAGMQTMYNAVRSTGASNLVFIAGKEGSTPAATQVSGVNIVLSVHVYYWDPDTILDRWQMLAQEYPVMCTEFGFPTYGGDGSDYARVIAACERRGWGWAAFAFDGAVNGPFDLIADTTTYAPAPSGVPVRNGFEANG